MLLLPCLAIQAEEGNLWGWGLLSFKLREFTGHKEYKPVKKSPMIAIKSKFSIGDTIIHLLKIGLLALTKDSFSPAVNCLWWEWYKLR